MELYVHLRKNEEENFNDLIKVKIEKEDALINDLVNVITSQLTKKSVID
jgi:hypothetical protein